KFTEELRKVEDGGGPEVGRGTGALEWTRNSRGTNPPRALGLPAAPDADWVCACLGGSDAPVVAATDYVRAVPEQIRAWVPAPYRTLGTDGFGRSDTRARLRDFFEVSADWIVLHALDSLGRQAQADTLRQKLGAATRATPPWAQ
ncbi:transketolase-like TK C-terminal-containing protein, partial [Achromobacter xylosoxidans]|uniref:transketolase-like TK C-terminal-containing protein n=1 Tax=Alcaligenes xylosoxydans xylosoxydans TaxID=85698 RepID=UPI0038FCB5FB